MTGGRKGPGSMFGRKTLDRIERMLDDAIAGKFQESDYDETQLSRVESKWKHYLGLSGHLRENLEREKENIKGLVSDISHQVRTPLSGIMLYAGLLHEQALDADTALLADKMIMEGA